MASLWSGILTLLALARPPLGERRALLAPVDGGVQHDAAPLRPRAALLLLR